MSYTRRTKDELAARVAMDIPEGATVNLGIGQPTLSQQLTVLRDEELVSTRREGKNIIYQLSSPQALALMEVLYAQLCSTDKEGL